jgi:hypothetical protein
MYIHPGWDTAKDAGSFTVRMEGGSIVSSYAPQIVSSYSPKLSSELNLTTWPESARELYRPTDRRLSVKLVPTFADRGCHVVSVTDPFGRILDFLDRSRYFSIK